MRVIYPLIFLLSLLFFGCKNSEKADELAEIDDSISEQLANSQQLSAENVFNSIPARADIIQLISHDEIEYDPNYLNNPDLASKYALENSRALNLGVYGADLSITGAFDQTQESMLFLKCVNILAKNLGVSTAFDQQMMDRMEANKDNRDSTLEIISQSFQRADEFLKANNRPGTSALLLCGSWIEGMYVSVQIAKKIKSEETIKTILEQQESLKHLIILAEASGLSEDGIYILDGLKSIQQELKLANERGQRNLENIKILSADIIELRRKVVDTF